MRRSLSIAICSLCLLATVHARQWQMGASGNAVLADQFSSQFGANAFGTTPDGSWFVSGTAATTIYTFTTNKAPGTYSFTLDGGNATGTEAVRVIGGQLVSYRIPHTWFFTWNGSNSLVMQGPDFSPPATNSFSWTFGPEWAGSIVQVRATNGAVLGSWGLPSVISSNYVLSSSIVTNANLLTGAQVFLDGMSAAALAMARTNANLNSVADRPGYEFGFDGTYQGGEWQIRRSDGSVAASGSAATFGTAVSGRVTVAEGNGATVWTRVPAGDGLGAAWIDTGVRVQGNNVTSYNFFSNPNPTPAPTPVLPNPTPAATPTPAPAAVSTPGTNSVASVAQATNDVEVNVESVSPVPFDDGEQGVVNRVVAAHEKLRNVLEDIQGAFDNVAMTFNEFREFTLGGVGTTCTFSFGNVTINLGGLVPGWLRTGMKLAILIVALFALIRYTKEAFT